MLLLLCVCYAGSGDLESKLEVAEAEVSQMRDAISMMSKRLEAREKNVAAQLQVRLAAYMLRVAHYG
jgi:hypothetical protein